MALETTLVTHGLPQPDGVRVAMALEEAVRECGAMPATIGIVAGKIHVGMSRRGIGAVGGDTECGEIEFEQLCGEPGGRGKRIDNGGGDDVRGGAGRD